MSAAAPFSEGRRAFGWRTWTVAQWFCVLVGMLLVVRGISVLVTGASFRLPGTGWHASFHLLSGALLIAAHRRPRLAYRAAIAFAVVYGTVTVAGVVNGREVFGIIPVATRENFIHAVYVAVTLLVIALGPTRMPPAHDRRVSAGGGT
jgi:Domain of unknown function (DUF4383)